jgi:transcriptional regulator with XRE-family HTH domain
MAKTSRPDAFTQVQKGVGQRIAWVREIVMPNRAEAARLIGVDPSTLAKIESGDRAPSIFNVLEIANRFRCSTDFLLRGLLTAQTDMEMALALAARHPELVLPPEYREERMGSGTDAGTHQPPKRPRVAN